MLNAIMNNKTRYAIYYLKKQGHSRSYLAEKVLWITTMCKISIIVAFHKQEQYIVNS